MKAIETRYQGYRFRSRLEARWAVYFDSIGARWEYEKEGYDLGPELGAYLPDFFVYMSPQWERARITPTAGYWIEIKPVDPTILERRKIAALALQTGHHAYILVGMPGTHWHWQASMDPKISARHNGCLLGRESFWPDCEVMTALWWESYLWARDGLDLEKSSVENAISQSRGARFSQASGAH